ncbi:hypothetical protein KXD93_22255 [Mucilaginibacter sp. BJC16-A38]|uniref:hypothetical protein n=1 Tax=Mucilaginibacter phenanthrenivorans TaxID=1234842 RepID=UPI0021584652|nr:hypothetical protein [Mucilaginibacter phenanthrenivorans]MCR8560393.1 hypothetical protein [Mucilaginibacter phenanthrenivorans]
MFDWLYSIGKTFRLITSNMLNHLKGYDIHCSGYYGTPYATYLGITFIAITLVGLALQYFIIDIPPKRPTGTWWLIALIIALINFIAAYCVIGSSTAPGHHCKDLSITTLDVIGVCFFNVVCGLFLAMVITGLPWLRRLSTNNVFTTFFKNN